VPFAAGVEGRDPHQAVDATLGLEIAVGVFAGGGERSALDAGFLARLVVDQLELVAFALHPTGVHAIEHLRPVLGLGPAGAGVDGDDGVLCIVLSVEHQFEAKRSTRCRRSVVWRERSPRVASSDSSTAIS